MPERSPAPPYANWMQYLELLPRYSFDGYAEHIAVADRIRVLASTCRSTTLIDCGPGPGRLWPLLVPHPFGSIVAVEPNKSLWKPTAEPVRYLQFDGLNYLLNNPTSAEELVAWMWSLNYALLSYFERYSVEDKRILQFNWQQADADCRVAVQRMLQSTCLSPLFVSFFDANNIEQDFITAQWSTVAPFPFADRSYTRYLFEDELMTHCATYDRRLRIERLAGVANYGTFLEAKKRMHMFQFRGHFASDPGADDRITRFLADFAVANEVRIPTSSYLYSVEPC